MIRKSCRRKGPSFRLLVSVSASLALREANDTSWVARFGWFCVRKSGVSSHPAGSAPRQNTAGRGQIHAFMFFRHIKCLGCISHLWCFPGCDESTIVNMNKPRYFQQSGKPDKWESTFLWSSHEAELAVTSLSGESQGWGSLVGCHLWGHTESDTTEVT